MSEEQLKNYKKIIELGKKHGLSSEDMNEGFFDQMGRAFGYAGAGAVAGAGIGLATPIPAPPHIKAGIGAGIGLIGGTIVAFSETNDKLDRIKAFKEEAKKSGLKPEDFINLGLSSEDVTQLESYLSLKKQGALSGYKWSSNKEQLLAQAEERQKIRTAEQIDKDTADMKKLAGSILLGDDRDYYTTLSEYGIPNPLKNQFSRDSEGKVIIRNGQISFSDSPYVTAPDWNQVGQNAKNLIREGTDLIGIPRNYTETAFNLTEKLGGTAYDLGSTGIDAMSQLAGQFSINDMSNFLGGSLDIIKQTISSGTSTLGSSLQALMQNMSSFNQSELKASEATAQATQSMASQMNDTFTPTHHYDEGTPTVGSNQSFTSTGAVPAVVHQGEMIVPAKMNPFGNGTKYAITNPSVSTNASDLSWATSAYKALSSADKTGLANFIKKASNASDSSSALWDIQKNNALTFRTLSQGNIQNTQQIVNAYVNSMNAQMSQDAANAELSANLQAVQIEQNNTAGQQLNTEIEQLGSALQQQGDDAVRQNILIDTSSKQLKSFDDYVKFFQQFTEDWKQTEKSHSEMYNAILYNIMGVHNNTGGIAMILIQMAQGGANLTGQQNNQSTATTPSTTANTKVKTDVSGTKMGDIAMKVADLAGIERPDLVLAQMMHESGGTSIEELEKKGYWGIKDHNLSGITWSEKWGADRKGSRRKEGGYYVKFKDWATRQLQ